MAALQQGLVVIAHSFSFDGRYRGAKLTGGQKRGIRLSTVFTRRCLSLISRCYGFKAKRRVLFHALLRE
ncbi:hypothetical protein AXE65_11400 [Ventosimonas gracilis]|uniref:Uncharacterized protein n=1 Tax=Ventosimonas gracilis TaxID=1680762 RepID=A0A139SWZ9_9GAMM|nr:hypothetical protein AXE65_11400 [Ventosimonas gracilis]